VEIVRHDQTRLAPRTSQWLSDECGRQVIPVTDDAKQLQRAAAGEPCVLPAIEPDDLTRRAEIELDLSAHVALERRLGHLCATRRAVHRLRVRISATPMSRACKRASSCLSGGIAFRYSTTACRATRTSRIRTEVGNTWTRHSSDSAKETSWSAYAITAI